MVRPMGAVPHPKTANHHVRSTNEVFGKDDVREVSDEVEE
jgi:desulfoferrodoxin (superoxide reductase-like protein)